jgi:hypothetical protein
MIEYSILPVPTSLISPINLTDILYNCPICDNEIEIDMLVDNESSIKCNLCEHIIKFEIKQV